MPNFFVVNVAFSPNGKWIAAASNSTKTGVKFRPDGALLVVGLGPDMIALWDVATGSEVRTFRSLLGSRSVKFSSDGQLLAGAGFSGPVLFYVGDLSW
jgi:WD40 repeat protein